MCGGQDVTLRPCRIVRTMTLPRPPRTGGEPRVQRKRMARIDRILMAAAEELGRHGYGNTSLDGIAERLDVTKASLYYYFDSKETLLRACIEAVAEQSIARIEDAAAAGGSAGERLRRLVSVQVR